MWERTLIESKGTHKEAERWWTIPVAAFVHGAVIMIALLISYWHVEALNPPPPKMVILESIPIKISPPPKRGSGGTTLQKRNIEKKPPVELTQPVEVPTLESESKISAEQFGPETDNVEDPNAPPGEGVPDGVDGGWGNESFETGPGIAQDEAPRQIVAGVTPPVLIKRVEPPYPRLAAHMRLHGIVILEAVINKTGSVEQIRTLRSDNALLENAARDAVLQWKYKPATFQGRPIKVYFTVTIRFHLK